MDGRTIAWVSYITFIGWIIAFVSHSNALVKSSLATFHLRQSFGLMVTWFALMLIRLIVAMVMPFFGLVFTVLHTCPRAFRAMGHRPFKRCER
jgi:hypothetical protein